MRLGIADAPMFKVFLGSTFKDLHEHRAAVQAAINRRDDCKAIVMEEFGARAGRPKEVCLGVLLGSWARQQGSASRCPTAAKYS